MKDFMNNTPVISKAGRAVRSIALSSQHLKKAKKMAAKLVTRVLSKREIFSPVAASICVILVLTFVTSLLGSF